MSEAEDRFELDAIDRAVIEALQLDGRTPYREVAAELGVPESEIERRAAELLGTGVMSVVAVTDPLRLGYARQAIFGLEIDGPADPVLDAVELIEEAIYVVHLDDAISAMVEVVGSSDAHLLELAVRIRRIVGVRRIHTFLVTEVVKENYTYGTA